VAGAAARAIKRIGSPAVPHLLNALEVDALRRRAARLLRSVPPSGDKAERESMAELLDLESARPAIAAVDALGEHGAKGVPLLLQAAGDGPKEVGRRAMRALRTIGKPAVTTLAKALNDKKASVRACAAASLSDIARKVSQRPVSRMIHRLKDATEDKDPVVRNAAVEALSQLTDYPDRVLPPLVAALGDKEASVSLQAVMAVLKVGSDREDVAEQMIEVLGKRRSSDYCRVGACMVLMHLGADAKTAMPALVKALDDESAEVREYAHLALSAIRTPSMRLNVIRTASMRLKAVDDPPKKRAAKKAAKKRAAKKKGAKKRAGKKKAGVRRRSGGGRR
jgi:HEAT repeat protein